LHSAPAANTERIIVRTTTWIGLLAFASMALGFSPTSSAQSNTGLNAFFDSVPGVNDGPTERDGDRPRVGQASAISAGPGDTVRLQTGSRSLRPVQAPKLLGLEGSGTIKLNAGDSICGGFIFLQSEGYPGSIAVSRLSDRKLVGRVAGGQWVRCVGSLAFIEAVGPPAVVDLSSGEIIRLSVSVPENQKIAYAKLFPVGDASGQVEALLYVNAQGGQSYVGRWRPGTSRVGLTPSPFSEISEAHEVAGDLHIFGVPSDVPNAKRAIYRYSDAGPRKLPAHDVSFSVLMDSGFLAYSNSTDDSIGVISPDGSQDRLPNLGCLAGPNTIAASAQGMLVSCHDRDHEDRFLNFGYFSPATGWRTWRKQMQYPLSSPYINRRMIPGRTVLSEIYQSDRPTGTWFDMSRGVFFEGSMLWPMHQWGSGQGTRLLATSVGAVEGVRQHSIDVYHIDLKRGVEEKLLTYNDCPGFLLLADVHEGRFLVHCIVQPELNTFKFKHQWSELLDVDAGTRWRETGRRHEAFMLDGTVLVSNLKAGSNAIRENPKRLWLESSRLPNLSAQSVRKN